MAPNETIAKSAGLRVAIIGQSQFAADVFESLQKRGHLIVGVFTILDKNNREDPLASVAKKHKVPVFKIKAWRSKGLVIPSIFEDYKKLGVQLNVLPYCSQFIPMEIITYPQYETICYHPSILPRHRGASAISWTLIMGDSRAGFTIFYPDDGLDTGPILLQESTLVFNHDTVDSLYKRYLYPKGVEACVKAVDLIAEGGAPRNPQKEEGATYEALLNKPELQKIDWSKCGRDLHNFIRGMDSVPGAMCHIRLPNTLDDQEVLLFGSSLWLDPIPKSGIKIEISGNPKAGLVHEEGLLIFGGDAVAVNVKRVKINGRVRPASSLCTTDKETKIILTNEEEGAVEKIKNIWEQILKLEIEEGTDFFASGAGSMDVVRLVEEVKDLLSVELQNEDLFMNPNFASFANVAIWKIRGGTKNGGTDAQLEYKAVELFANKMKLRFPCQLFINGEFLDAEGGKKLTVVNPADESVICEVECASAPDVEKAVTAAKTAFERGEWSKISARERGDILFKLAALMEEHKEELATLESLDSGAVYTLALKTHIGMSIQTWRYFAGCCDKIQGSTIPISHARPNRNLSFTKKEPIGVCGLITPWNYPLMMLSWKMAPCLAAGNTVIIKPAQVCPLTALKFAELCVRAGIPPGVVNVLPGTGSGAGNALAAHHEVRKLGFTGSTEIGQIIMRTCADSNLKKCSLELGGKSPLVIFADCDLEKAVKVAMQAVFFNKGENCIAAGRIFIENSIHNQFLARLVRETKKIVIGDPLNRSTSHGPQNHHAHLVKLIDYVRQGVAEGAKLEIGGKRWGQKGFFFEPTILTNVEDFMYIAKEESFGPIMVISRFDEGDLEGVIKRSNCTEYGLAAGVFTNDISKALKFSEQVHAGTVFVNTYNKTDVACPFGGFKKSGFGKDLGLEALNEYLNTKCITIEY